MKNFNGKAIYNPAGKAGEYAEWACNFYVGCSNGCEYCYCKKGRSAKWLGGDTPTLKKCFRDETHALEVFEKELIQNLDELRQHGLFFSFTTDPMLPETKWLTLRAMDFANDNEVHVKILTKCTDWVDKFLLRADQLVCEDGSQNWRRDIAIGFTLTGHDEMELGASTNAERIEAMRKLHNAGFRTFSSIEPMIDECDSLEMILKTQGFCDLYKVGLMSGRKYHISNLREFIRACSRLIGKFYFKDSLLQQAGIDRANLPGNCVGRDYNIFTSNQ